MRKPLLFLLFLFTGIQLSKASTGCMLAPVSLEDRVNNSVFIAEGKVLSQYSFWNEARTSIYTSNKVLIFKTFKGQPAGTEIEIITEGGTVGNERVTHTSTLQLHTGDEGVFFCMPHTVKANGVPASDKPSYMVFSSLQGFIQYNLFGAPQGPFRLYNSKTEVYAAITSITGSGINTITPVNTPPANGNKTTAVPNISSFSPSTITAGTNDTLTINGTDFGATRGTGFVGFKNSDDGGSSFMIPLDTHYISWTNTQIKVLVPSAGNGGGTAGTGRFIVVNSDPNVDTSDTDLTVTYAISNVQFQANTYIPYHVNDNGAGGYSFLLHTDFNNNIAAKSSFMRALTSWCLTAINWDTAGATTVDVVAQDNTNIVRFDNGSELPTGVLGRCTSYYSGCVSGGVVSWYVTELDIAFDDGTNWEYGPTLPSFTEYDFESVAVHELGHGHQLSHIIDASAVMHFSISNGQTKRVLNPLVDIAAGSYVMNRNIGATPCSQTSMTLKVCTPLPLTLLSFTGEYIAGKGVDLNWQTANEALAENYIIQRSSNGKDFENIGTVVANAGDINGIYSYLDAEPRSGIMYYRLMQKQLSGSFNYSNVVTIAIGNNGGIVNIYPNPARDNVTIAYVSQTELHSVIIEITDINGKVMVSEQVKANGDAISANLNTANTPNGMYFYTIKEGKETVARGKLMIAK